jgi:hypothetical protein
MKYSNKTVAEKVSWEGLDYTIQNYFSGDEFKDPKLAEAWKIAKKAMKDIEDILNPYME